MKEESGFGKNSEQTTYCISKILCNPKNSQLPEQLQHYNTNILCNNPKKQNIQEGKWRHLLFKPGVGKLQPGGHGLNYLIWPTKLEEITVF